MKSNIIAIMCGLFVTGMAYADCPSSLNKQEMAKCQQVEKTGMNYQEWKKEQENMAKSDTKSPITGEDVTKIAPAAGEDSAE